MKQTRKRQGGFTMIEVMVALLVLLIGLSGLLGMHMSGLRATSYSRHAGEASVIGEAKLEQMRIIPSTVLIAAGSGVETGLSGQGVAAANGPYTRSWTVTEIFDSSSKTMGAHIVVKVSWQERGSEQTTLSFVTQVGVEEEP